MADVTVRRVDFGYFVLPEVPPLTAQVQILGNGLPEAY
jgi:hypothetical protein